MHRVDPLGEPTRHARHREDHLEVLLLGCADHVEQQVRPETLHTVDDTGEVAGGVVEATGAGLDDERQRFALAVGEAVGEHDARPIALLHEAGGLEPVDGGPHTRLVHALARQVFIGEEHAELVVDGVEVLRRHGHQPPPEGTGLGVAALEGDHPRPGALLELLGVGELGVGLLVEVVEVALAESRRGHVLTEVEQMLDEHPEGAPPVADVVLADHGVAGELVEPHQRVTDDRRAQVADVHLLGDVRSRVVDDHGARRSGHSTSEPLVGSGATGHLRQEPVGEHEVHEPGSSDLDRGAHPVEHSAVDDPLGDLPRVATERLGERKRAVDLGVGVIGRTHHRVGGGAGELGEHRLEERGHPFERVDTGVVRGTGHQPTIVSEGGPEATDSDRGGAEGVATGDARLGHHITDLGVVERAEHAPDHAAVDRADHRVIGGDITEGAVGVDDPETVVPTLGVGGEPVGGEGIGHGLDRGPQGTVPLFEGLPVEADGHGAAVLGADLLGEPFGLVGGESVERATEERQHEVVAADRELGESVGDRPVSLRRTPGPATVEAGGAHLEVPASRQLLEMVSGDIGVDPDLLGHRGGGQAIGARLADQQVHAAPRRIAEGIGDGRHRRRERGRGGHGSSVGGFSPTGVVQTLGGIARMWP